MKTARSLLFLFAILLAPAEVRADYTQQFMAGDAYSRVLCRLESDTEGEYLSHLSVSSAVGEVVPPISCRVQSFEYYEEDGKLLRRRIGNLSQLRWERWDALPPLEDDADELRRYFVLPEICFHEDDTWRCKKLLHEKGERFTVELGQECPLFVKIAAMPVVTTFVTDKTAPPLDTQGVKIQTDDSLTSNPFAFHPALSVDGMYYRDLAIVKVKCGGGCEEPPCTRVTTCAASGPNGRWEAGESCDDGNLINEPNSDPLQCRNDCTKCGDGIQQATEACDDGNEIDEGNGAAGGQCRPDCTKCGDGELQSEFGEVCDPPGSTFVDGAGNTLTCGQSCFGAPLSFCGDGVLDSSVETCDPGNPVATPPLPPASDNPGSSCRLASEPGSCTYCGDGVINTYVDAGGATIALEECDPGDAAAGIAPASNNPAGTCDAQCQTRQPEVCRMFRDPSFSRDHQGMPRLKANGRMEALDASVAGPNDEKVVDIGTESITVAATTREEGTVFTRTFAPGDLNFFRDGGNEGWEFGKGTSEEFKLKIKTAHTRFNMELPGDQPMDDLLKEVEAGNVHWRLVEFSIHFENADVRCAAETVWDCKKTDKRGSCKGLLQ